MTELVQLTIVVAFFRAATVFCGLAALAMGYRLFSVGVYERAGDLKAAWGDRSLLLKQAAPGTFFALFGAVIVVAGISAGLGVSHRTTTGPGGGQVVGETVLRSNVLSRANLIDGQYKSGELTAERAYEALYRLVTTAGTEGQ